MKLVVIESPFAGERGRNRAYLLRAMRDSIERGEAPFASHLLYTIPGLLEDDILSERRLGMEAGFAWGKMAELTAVYVDLGVTQGMMDGMERARRDGRPVEIRRLDAGANAA